METFLSGLCFAQDLLFKSYYVVWKLPLLYTATDNEGEFKSYYVVWKQKSVDEKEIIEMV